MKIPAMALVDELRGLVPAAEPEPVDAGAAELEDIRAQARTALGLPAHAELEEIQAAFGESMDAFWDFFFPHYRQDPDTGVEIAPAPFHAELIGDIEDLLLRRSVRRSVKRAIAREHGKSVIATLVTPVWCTANKISAFPFIFSDTRTQAANLTTDIMMEVNTNERLQAIYPEYCTWAAKPAVGRAVCRLVFGNGTVLMAAGSGTAVRGARYGTMRPTLIIGDDVDRDKKGKGLATREDFAGKKKWWNRVVKKLGRAALYIIVGTIIDAESFLSGELRGNPESIYKAVVHYPDRMDLWGEWAEFFRDYSRTEEQREQAALAFYQARRALMDAGAQVLWPARFSLYELMHERMQDLASFLSERQNEPFDPAACYFPQDGLRFLEAADMPAADQVRFSVLFWDPSRGTSKSDVSAAVRLDVLADGRRVVSQAIADRIPPEQVIEGIVGMHRQRPFLVVGVEKVGLSSYDESLQAKAREHGLALPVEPTTPVGEKKLRIKSMRPLVVIQALVFAADLPEEAIQQIKLFPQHPNDDVWDSIQQANTLADAYAGGQQPAGASVEPGPGAGRIERQGVIEGQRPDWLPQAGRPAGAISTIIGRMRTWAG